MTLALADYLPLRVRVRAHVRAGDFLAMITVDEASVTRHI